MERVIKIDGKEIPFKCTAGTARRYRLFFGKDLIADADRLIKALQDQDRPQLTPELLVTFENLAYVMAKQADPEIPGSPDEWLDTFEMFSIYDILPQIIEMWQKSLQGIESVKKNQLTSRRTKAKSGR